MLEARLLEVDPCERKSLIAVTQFIMSNLTFILFAITISFKETITRAIAIIKYHLKSLKISLSF